MGVFVTTNSFVTTFVFLKLFEADGFLEDKHFEANGFFYSAVHRRSRVSVSWLVRISG